MVIAHVSWSNLLAKERVKESREQSRDDKKLNDYVDFHKLYIVERNDVER